MANGQQGGGFLSPYARVPEGQPQDPTSPSGGPATRQFIGGAMIKLGSSLMKPYLEQELGGDFAEAAGEISDSMISSINDRWWRQEYENFEAAQLSNYQNEVKQLWDQYDLSDTEMEKQGFTPETVQQREQLMKDLIQNVQQADIKLMQEAAKFGQNPYIGNMANQLMTSRAKAFQEMMGAGGQIHQQEQQVQSTRKATAEASKAETEAGLAEEKIKSEIFRNYQAGKTGKKEDKPPMNPSELPMWLSTTTKGRNYLSSKVAALEGQYETQLREQYAGEFESPDDLIDAKLASEAENIRRAAIGLSLLEITGLDPNIISANPQLAPYMNAAETYTAAPQREDVSDIPKMPARASKKEYEITRDAIYNKILTAVVESYRTGITKSKEDALAQAVPIIKQEVKLSGGSRAIQDRMVKELIRQISAAEIPEIEEREAFAKGRKKRPDRTLLRRARPKTPTEAFLTTGLP